MQNQMGLVLTKKNSQSLKHIVLDNVIGKIMCIVEARDERKVFQGALISYNVVVQRNGNHMLAQVEVIGLPFEWARHDIVFLHQIFELLYHFIPIGSGPVPVLDLIQFLYRDESKLLLDSPFKKKLLLCKLFIIIGVQPEDSRFDSPFFHMISAVPIDLLVQSDLQLISACAANHRELDQWLMHCIASHPYAHYFKTIKFFSGSS